MENKVIKIQDYLESKRVVEKKEEVKLTKFDKFIWSKFAQFLYGLGFIWLVCQYAL